MIIKIYAEKLLRLAGGHLAAKNHKNLSILEIVVQIKEEVRYCPLPTKGEKINANDDIIVEHMICLLNEYFSNLFD